MVSVGVVFFNLLNFNSMNTVVISKDGSIRDAFKQGGRMYYYLTEETIEQTFVTTEQVYDLSKLTAAQLKGLLKNCLVKPVVELPKPAGYDQWVADGKPMPILPALKVGGLTITGKIDIPKYESFINY